MERLAAVFFILTGFSLFGQSAIEYNRLGDKKLAENDVYSALEYFSRSVEQNPRYHQSLYGMANAYFRLEEYEAADFYIGLALEKSGENLVYLNLQGRIDIGLGELEKAAEVFDSILIKEPYNMTARLGLAEIDLIENRFSEAEERYLGSLTISPESRRALLSLLLLYDTKGDFSKGDRILETLNRVYTYDPDVKLAAAQHYYRSGELDKAEDSALTLFSINPSSSDVRPLLARIYLEKDEAEKSIGFLEEQLKSERTDLGLRYLLAVSYSRIGRITESLHNFDYILKNAPYDEISRMAAENLAVKNRLESKIEEYASYHFSKGQQWEKNFRYDKALIEYRRGLKIDPTSVTGRLLYADIFKLRGQAGKYLDILNLLTWNGYDDPDFLASKMQFEHLKEESVAGDWAVDQFYLVKDRYKLDLYIRKPDIKTEHSVAEQYIAEYFNYELEKYEWLDTPEEAVIINGESDAYRLSHKSGSQYYVILDFFESSRIFTLNVSLYLSRTGVLMDRYTVIRAGNEKLSDSVSLSSSYLSRFLPVRGNIVNVNDGKALINLGELDGIKVEDRFLIGRKGQVRYISEEPWYEIPDQDKLGLLTVTALDEAVAECSYENPGFFELLNPGDDVFLLNKNEEITLESDFGYNETLKRELLRIH
ncbi:MAG: hypothetical protein JXR86_07555 [Spirochaetales bacterium]|nr:hypothetical protein [Spirochaetales bacterium]